MRAIDQLRTLRGRLHGLDAAEHAADVAALDVAIRLLGLAHEVGQRMRAHAVADAAWSWCAKKTTAKRDALRDASNALALAEANMKLEALALVGSDGT